MLHSDLALRIRNKIEYKVNVYADFRALSFQFYADFELLFL